MHNEKNNYSIELEGHMVYQLDFFEESATPSSATASAKIKYFVISVVDSLHTAQVVTSECPQTATGSSRLTAPIVFDALYRHTKTSVLPYASSAQSDFIVQLNAIIASAQDKGIEAVTLGESMKATCAILQSASQHAKTSGERYLLGQLKIFFSRIIELETSSGLLSLADLKNEVTQLSAKIFPKRMQAEQQQDALAYNAAGHNYYHLQLLQALDSDLLAIIQAITPEILSTTDSQTILVFEHHTLRREGGVPLLGAASKRWQFQTRESTHSSNYLHWILWRISTIADESRQHEAQRALCEKLTQICVSNLGFEQQLQIYFSQQDSKQMTPLLCALEYGLAELFSWSVVKFPPTTKHPAWKTAVDYQDWLFEQLAQGHFAAIDRLLQTDVQLAFLPFSWKFRSHTMSLPRVYEVAICNPRFEKESEKVTVVKFYLKEQRPAYELRLGTGSAYGKSLQKAEDLQLIFPEIMDQDIFSAPDDQLDTVVRPVIAKLMTVLLKREYELFAIDPVAAYQLFLTTKPIYHALTHSCDVNGSLVDRDKTRTAIRQLCDFLLAKLAPQTPIESVKLLVNIFRKFSAQIDNIAVLRLMYEVCCEYHAELDPCSQFKPLSRTIFTKQLLKNVSLLISCNHYLQDLGYMLCACVPDSLDWQDFRSIMTFYCESSSLPVIILWNQFVNGPSNGLPKSIANEVSWAFYLKDEATRVSYLKHAMQAGQSDLLYYFVVYLQWSLTKTTEFSELPSSVYGYVRYPVILALLAIGDPEQQIRMLKVCVDALGGEKQFVEQVLCHRFEQNQKTKSTVTVYEFVCKDYMSPEQQPVDFCSPLAKAMTDMMLRHLPPQQAQNLLLRVLLENIIKNEMLLLRSFFHYKTTSATPAPLRELIHGVNGAWQYLCNSVRYREVWNAAAESEKERQMRLLTEYNTQLTQESDELLPEISEIECEQMRDFINKVQQCVGALPQATISEGHSTATCQAQINVTTLVEEMQRILEESYLQIEQETQQIRASSAERDAQKKAQAEAAEAKAVLEAKLAAATKVMPVAANSSLSSVVGPVGDGSASVVLASGSKKIPKFHMNIFMDWALREVYLATNPSAEKRATYELSCKAIFALLELGIKCDKYFESDKRDGYDLFGITAENVERIKGHLQQFIACWTYIRDYIQKCRTALPTILTEKIWDQLQPNFVDPGCGPIVNVRQNGPGARIGNIKKILSEMFEPAHHSSETKALVSTVFSDTPASELTAMQQLKRVHSAFCVSAEINFHNIARNLWESEGGLGNEPWVVAEQPRDVQPTP